MKLHLASNAGANQFTGYGDGYVEINKTRHEGSVLVTIDSITAWPVENVGALADTHFDQILAANPEVVLLGTGPTLQFPHPRLYKALTARQIGVEVMDTNAACRTFNILMSEGRRVVAAILHR